MLAFSAAMPQRWRYPTITRWRHWDFQHPAKLELELEPPADAVVQRIFRMALQDESNLNITKTLNRESIASPHGSRWTKTAVHRFLTNETYNRNIGLESQGQGQYPASAGGGSLSGLGLPLGIRPCGRNPSRPSEECVIEGE